MTNTGDMIRQIGTMMAQLSADAVTSAAEGRTDRAKELERIVGRLLDTIFDGHFVNQNSDGPTFPAIDLGDPAKKIAVQVTVRKDRDKVQTALDDFLKYDLERTFDRLIVVMFVDKVQFRDEIRPSEIYSPRNFHFRKKDDVWDLRKLNREIEDLEDHQIEQIYHYLEKQTGRTVPQYPAHLLPTVPPATHSFITGSRDGELAKLIPAVESGEPVYIWGLGGMGKTQVAIQLAKHVKTSKGAYFLHYTLPLDGRGEAMRETILQARFSGYQFRGPDNERRDAEYRERMDLLRNEYAGALLIIDNFDWPGKSLTDLQSEQAFADLTQSGLKLVFTTRYAVDVADWRIGPISDGSLLELIRRSYQDRSVTDETLLELIRAVNGHTLMADLMAKTLARSRGRVTPQSLLEALRKSDLDQEDFPDVTSDRNSEISQRQIYAHLQALFDLSDMKVGEWDVLRCATLLPEDGMDYNLFRDALPKEQRNVLDSLVDSSWLQCEHILLTIHPLIREVCMKELRLTDDNCCSFLYRLQECMESEGVISGEKYLQITQSFSMASDNLPDSNGQWSYWAAIWWKSIGQYQIALCYDLRYIDCCNKYDLGDENTAAAYFGLGLTYHSLGQYQLAIDSYNQSLKIRKGMHEGDPKDIAAIYSNLGSAYDGCEDHKQALKSKLKAMEIFENDSDTLPHQLATCYNNIGVTYGRLNMPDQELVYKQKSHKILLVSSDPGDLALASSFENLAMYFLRCGEARVALDYQRKGMKIRRNGGAGDELWLANSYFNMGMIFVALKNEEQCEVNFKKAMKILEEYSIQEHPTLIYITETIAQVRKNRHKHFA